MAVEVDVKINFKKIEGMFTEDFAREFDYIFMKLYRGEIERYTPFLTGQMMNTSFVPVVTSSAEGGKIVYPAVYATYQWYGVSVKGKKFKYTLIPHPEARKEWGWAINQRQADELIRLATRPIFDKYAYRSKDL